MIEAELEFALETSFGARVDVLSQRFANYTGDPADSAETLKLARQAFVSKLAELGYQIVRLPEELHGIEASAQQSSEHSAAFDI